MSTDRQRDGDRQSDLAVMDANEFKQKRRLKRILDNLEDVQDRKREAWQLYVTGEIGRDGRNIIIQHAVQDAIDSCYNLLKDHNREVGDGDDKYFSDSEDDPIGWIKLDGENAYVIKGLKEYLEAPEFYTKEVTESVKRRNMNDETVTRTVDVTMPEWISYRAFRRLKLFLNDVKDMEISFEEMDDELPNWGFDSMQKDELDEDVVVL